MSDEDKTCYHIVVDREDCPAYPPDSFNEIEMVFAVRDISAFLDEVNKKPENPYELSYNYSFNRVLAIMSASGEWIYRTPEFMYRSKLSEINPDLLEHIYE